MYMLLFIELYGLEGGQMNQVKDFRASLLRQQIIELQRFLKALEKNRSFQSDSELGMETLSNIEFQLRQLRMEMKKKFLTY